MKTKTRLYSLVFLFDKIIKNDKVDKKNCMRKISERNQQILDDAIAKGVDLLPLRKHHSVRWIIQLYKSVLRLSKIGMIEFYKDMPRGNDNAKIPTDDLANLLKQCGFKLKSWSEDFIDEDTGRVVRVKRYAILPFASH